MTANRPLIVLVLALSAGACARPAPPAPAPAPEPVVVADSLPQAPDTLIVAVPAPDTTPPPPPPRVGTVSFAFTGDINLGTTTLPGGVPPDSGRAVLAAAHPALVGDFVVGNLEGVFADTGISEKCIGRTNCYAFRTPVFLAERLRDAGFTHLNLANNHSNDLGSAGRASTRAILNELDLEFYGPLGAIAIDTVMRGDSVSVVGLVGFTTYPFAYNLLDIERSAAVIDSVRPLVDVLIVTFHGGAEGRKALSTGDGPEFLGREPRGDLRRWARAVIDAGADAVIGHGPHVLRGIEFYAGRPIAYSLGNFATYRGFNVSGPLGITGVLQLELAGDGTFSAARFVPMDQARLRGPAPDPSAAAIDLLRRLSREDFGPTGARITEDGRILPP